MSEEPIADRFWEKVSRGAGDSCWLWTDVVRNGSKSYRYGIFSRGAQGNIGAHRFSYELHYGPIPAGMFVCHRCDVSACVRPDHLFLGTPADNTNDAAAKGRMARGERNGSAKLNETEVEEIRLRGAAGESQRSLARSFGVSQRAVQFIVGGVTWRHVAKVSP